MQCFPFLFLKRSPSYRQRKRSLDFAPDDDTRNAPFPLSAIRCFPFLAVKHAPSYRQRKRSLDFAPDDDTRNAPFPLSAIRCFLFLAIGHAPSCRQRKRSLDFARDDDTRTVLFPQILCMMHGIAIPHAVISSVARNLFRPSFSHDSFAKPSAGSTVHLSAIRCFPFLFLKHSPSYR